MQSRLLLSWRLLLLLLLSLLLLVELLFSHSLSGNVGCWNAVTELHVLWIDVREEGVVCRLRLDREVV